MLFVLCFDSDAKGRGGEIMLTRKQFELLRFIHERLRESGVPPSFDEMKDALDLRSKSGIHRLIMALEERGFIRRLPNRARALEVIKMPDGIGGPQAQRGRFSPSVVQGGLGQTPPAPAANLAKPRPAGAEENGRSTVSIPVMGRIAAGTPISAIQDRSHSVSMPADMLGGGEHYALEVRGDSMIEARCEGGRVMRVEDEARDLVLLVGDQRFMQEGPQRQIRERDPCRHHLLHVAGPVQFGLL